MGCCCSSENKNSGRKNSTELKNRRTAETDAIPFTPNPNQIPNVRVYRDDIRNNNQ